MSYLVFFLALCVFMHLRSVLHAPKIQAPEYIYINGYLKNIRSQAGCFSLPFMDQASADTASRHSRSHRLVYKLVKEEEL